MNRVMRIPPDTSTLRYFSVRANRQPIDDLFTSGVDAAIVLHEIHKRTVSWAGAFVSTSNRTWRIPSGRALTYQSQLDQKAFRRGTLVQA